jgi:hypothetical protein
MRFDAVHATDHVGALDFPRLAGTEGERQAAEYVAREMQGAGLTVERRDAGGSRVPEWIGTEPGWLAAQMLGAAAILIPTPTYRAVAALGALGVSAAMLLGLLRRPPARPPLRFATPIVVGRRSASPAPRARIVVLTHLDSDPRHWLGRAITNFDLVGFWLVGWNLARPSLPWLPLFAVVLALMAWYNMSRRPERAAREPSIFLALYLPFACLGALTSWLHSSGRDAWALAAIAPAIAWRLATLCEWPGFVPAALDEDRENRTGLAALIELARAWPADDAEGLDVAFAAVGARSAGMAGARELARMVADDWPKCPTLVVMIHAPTFGNTLMLSGRDRALRLAQQAARDLRIPHRDARWLGRLSEARRFGFRRLGTVRIAGALDETEPRTADDGLVQPAMLGASAQLVREVALRWLRRERGADHARPPLRAARSDQNPG